MDRKNFRKTGISFLKGAGLIATEWFNHKFDLVISPLIMFGCQLKWGKAMGTLIGTAIVVGCILVGNYINIQIYRLVGIGEIMAWIESKRTGIATRWWEKGLKAILNRGFWTVFLFLCLEDPSKAFIFARGATLGRSFNRKDWQWYIFANLIGGVAWGGGVGLITMGAKAIWPHLVTLWHLRYLYL